MTYSISRKVAGISLTDMAAVLFIYLVPTLSHLTALPLYILDPMRIAVLGALIATRSWKNSMALAITLPLFSYFIGGHPVLLKAGLIAAELCINVGLFAILSRKLSNMGVAAILSIIASKLAYYAIKAMFIGTGLLSMSLVSTGLVSQAVVAVLLSLGIMLSYKRN